MTIRRDREVNVRPVGQRPPAGLSTTDHAILGDPEAKEKVLAAYPELGARSAAGLSLIDWAQMGLVSAQRRVQEIVSKENGHRE